MVTTRRRTRSLSNASAQSGGEVSTTATRRLRTRSLSNATANDEIANSKPKTSKPKTRGRSRTLSKEKAELEIAMAQKQTAVEAEIDKDSVQPVADQNKEPGETSDSNVIEKSGDNKDKEAHSSDHSDDDDDDEEEEERRQDENDGKLEAESSKVTAKLLLRQPNLASLANTKKSKKKKQNKNELTHLIPGYTAPMKLSSSSLDKFRPAGGIRELQKRAQRTDASTKDFVLEATTKHTQAMTSSGGFLPKSYTTAYSSFKRGTKRAPDTSAGKGWFGMTPTAMTEEVKTDLAVIRNRTYLDPKRFYKSADKHHKVVQIGTVVEGPTEYFSSRLTKKQRRSNFTDEIMADPSSADYAKNKFKQMSREKNRQAETRKQKPKKIRKFY
jgi:Fcf2 pre-rRNA processing